MEYLGFLSCHGHIRLGVELTNLHKPKEREIKGFNSPNTKAKTGMGERDKRKTPPLPAINSSKKNSSNKGVGMKKSDTESIGKDDGICFILKKKKKV
jgi:hypothetical protein